MAERSAQDGSAVALGLRARRGYHRAIIAVAAKNARIIWALLARNRDFVLPE